MKKIVIANWKMNADTAFSLDYAQKLKTLLLPFAHDSNLIFCPPFPYITLLKQNFNSFSSIGGQNCHHKSSGAFTGEVSARMLQDLGCTHVILGHSERRQYNHETNEIVRLKAESALSEGLIPIICVGENLTDREAGNAKSIVLEQLQDSLPTNRASYMIAYEPLWAIGTGVVASLGEIAEMHASIHAYLMDVFGAPSPILYGGSVTEKNADEIMKIDHVDGVLVGGASLKPDIFAQIIGAA